MNIESKKLSNFRLRKIIHYSLILCILLIQLILAAFFYNEFIRKKNLSFIEKQIKEINSLEKITDNSRKELLNSQDYFQKYLETKDKKYLDLYFQSANNLTKSIDSINQFKNRNSKLKAILNDKKTDSIEVKKLKTLIDSTHKISSQTNLRIQDAVPSLKNYEINTSLESPLNIETKVYKDTVNKKKKLFGRLGDAISGKENVRKESIVVTMKKNGRITTPIQIKKEKDSIIKSINHYYSKEIKKIQLNVIKNKDESSKFYRVFNNLIIYSNSLMTIYESAIKDAKIELEKEYNKQNSKNNRIRNYLIFGAMALMFIVSILIMLLTRIAFLYEKRLKSANQQIEENLKFKNRILGMLSHELRTPLKIIGIFLNRINKKTEDPSIKEYLKSISFTNNTLLMHSNQILEYTKNQQVKNKLIPVNFNLKNEIQEILTSVRPYIETRNNVMVINENIDSTIEVFSDNTKINQLYMNILGNANKFTENGKITVNIKTENIDQNTISLITEIKDSGTGISSSDLEKIFEPYYQGILSEELENIGAGLGLSLCKEIVELFPGNISVTSVQNQGTTVKFDLNLKLIHHNA